MYQKSVLTLIVAINSKNVKRNGSWTEEEGQLITRMEALVAIKLVGTKFQVRVVATKELDRVDVAHHQSAEEGGEDDVLHHRGAGRVVPSIWTTGHPSPI